MTPELTPRMARSSVDSPPWRPGWLKWVIIAISLFILFGFVVGLPPAAGAIDYTRKFSLGEVIGYDWRFAGDVLDRRIIGLGLFAPAAVAGLIAFLRVRSVKLRRAVLAMNILLPALWLGIALTYYMVVSLPVLFMAMAGRCDGEDWSEGMVCVSAMGCWTVLWLLVASVLAGHRWLSRR